MNEIKKKYLEKCPWMREAPSNKDEALAELLAEDYVKWNGGWANRNRAGYYAVMLRGSHMAVRRESAQEAIDALAKSDQGFISGAYSGNFSG